ncbi:MAG: HD domain-containing protein [Spirochaetales bacterium]|uniref:HD domain-containing protein n=1 Tax=Candidatus Thalassospirochaeta sargassi TaxID=3119039 RepID=A0AAJ1IEP8_9SPIO|nr:HD domain-containing protein [Spirochaetales bacterium]
MKIDYLKARLTAELCSFFGNDFKRIEHALEVLNYSEIIAARIGGCDNEIITAASLFHDLGIKPAEEIYGHNNGKLQEELGPAEARLILNGQGFDKAKTDIVCDIISNHHSASRFKYPELEVLKQADAIVNKLHNEL